MMTPKVNIFNRLLQAVAALLVSASALFVWSVLFEAPYLHYQNLPFPAVPQVRAGQVVPLTIERCSSASEARSYTVTHALHRVGSKDAPHLLRDFVVSVDPGCHRSISMNNVVPPGARPGYYRVRGVALIEGRFRTHRVGWYSEAFEVLAPPPRSP